MQIAKMVASITDLEWTEEFTDDHTICMPIKFTDQDGRQRTITLMWCGPDGYAAVRYAESSDKAMADLIKLINNQIEFDQEEEDQEEEEEDQEEDE